MKMLSIYDPARIQERRARGVNYVVIGQSRYGLTEISAESEDDARYVGGLWKQCYGSRAECFCVQNGEIGGRPFHTFP